MKNNPSIIVYLLIYFWCINNPICLNKNDFIFPFLYFFHQSFSLLTPFPFYFNLMLLLSRYLLCLLSFNHYVFRRSSIFYVICYCFLSISQSNPFKYSLMLANHVLFKYSMLANQNLSDIILCQLFTFFKNNVYIK